MLATVAHNFRAIYVPQVHLSFLCGGGGFLFSYVSALAVLLFAARTNEDGNVQNNVRLFYQ